jgi:perosamine synthetase
MIHVSQPSIGSAEIDLVNEALRSNQITSGPMVRRFEAEFARLHGVPHAVACTSGTTALHLALVALGVGPGDEVLVPDLTYVATANAVAYAGARVRLVDIDRETGCFDMEDLARSITRMTRAVVPVHLYGTPVDMDDLGTVLSQARRHSSAGRIHVVEDAAEGLGGFYMQAKLGAIGDAGCFSFYGNKIITTGEGGMVITDNGRLAERLRFLRSMATNANPRYFHSELGFNYRMTDLQAAVGLGQLTHFDEMLASRMTICDRYSRALLGRSWQPGHAPWLFTFLLPEGCSRDVFMARLLDRGIETRPAFVPLHRMPMYAGRDADYPGAVFFGERGVSLPTYPEMSTSEVDSICDAVWTVLRSA